MSQPGSAWVRRPCPIHRQKETEPESPGTNGFPLPPFCFYPTPILGYDTGEWLETVMPQNAPSAVEVVLE